MIRLLPFILIPVLVVAGLGWWRYASTKSSLESPKTIISNGPIEVPKTLPGASIEDKVKALEDSLTSVVNKLNLPAPTPIADSSLDTRLKSVEAAVTELKVRVSSLENATPAPAVAASGKSSVYIPLGAGGYWSDIDWNSLTEYEVSLDPANYPGYTGMSLEANFRLAESAGTGSVRLYNVTDSSAASGTLDTTSTSFSLKTSSSFTIPSGTKTYRLQVKSTQRKDLFIQSARIKVNF